MDLVTRNDLLLKEFLNFIKSYYANICNKTKHFINSSNVSYFRPDNKNNTFDAIKFDEENVNKRDRFPKYHSAIIGYTPKTYIEERMEQIKFLIDNPQMINRNDFNNMKNKIYADGYYNVKKINENAYDISIPEPAYTKYRDTGKNIDHIKLTNCVQFRIKGNKKLNIFFKFDETLNYNQDDPLIRRINYLNNTNNSKQVLDELMLRTTKIISGKNYVFEKICNDFYTMLMNASAHLGMNTELIINTTGSIKNLKICDENDIAKIGKDLSEGNIISDNTITNNTLTNNIKNNKRIRKPNMSK